jgi:hypothetical protein
MMVSDKELYELACKLGSARAAGRELGLSESLAKDHVRAYRHKHKLPPVKHPPKATPEELYNAAVKLGSVANAARHFDMPNATVKEVIRDYRFRHDLPAIKAPDPATPKELFDKAVETGSMRQAAQFYGMCPESTRAQIKAYCKEHKVPIPAGTSRNKTETVPIVFPSNQKIETGGIRRYVITSMHNNTPLHQDGFRSLKLAAEHIGAQLCIIPLLYKNPTLFNAAESLSVSWPAEALPFTIYDNITINEEWLIAGKLHIQATAARPLQGMQGFSKNRSCVVGHARLAWETRPTPPGRPAIRQITTGSISNPQYSDTKLGQLSEFHHTLGALLIETDGERTFVRHLRPSTSTGEFYDFEHKFGPSGYLGTDDSPLPAVVFGDLHEWFSIEKYLIWDFGRRYKPLQTFIHDAMDSFSISHHHEKDPLMRAAKRTLKMDRLEDELNSLGKFHTELSEAIGPAGQIVYVSSNHTEDHLLHWLRTKDWRQIDGNTTIHRYVLNAYMDHLENPAHAEEYVSTGRLPSILSLLMQRQGVDLSNASFPSVNDSVMVADIECGQHGHRGPNGTRGSMGGFQRSQCKMIVGHSHTPGMQDGIYAVGTSGGLKMNYNDGLSGWDVVHATVDQLGKRRLFNTVAGNYRLEQ